LNSKQVLSCDFYLEWTIFVLLILMRSSQHSHQKWSALSIHCRSFSVSAMRANKDPDVWLLNRNVCFHNHPPLLSNYCEHKNYESHQLNTIVAQSNDNIISPHSTGSCNSTPEHIHSPPISNNNHKHDIPNDHNSQQANNTIANYSVTNVFPPPTTGYNSISVCFFNARSLVNILDLFKSYVLSTFHNIICVTETWLSDNIFNAEILPPPTVSIVMTVLLEAAVYL